MSSLSVDTALPPRAADACTSPAPTSSPMSVDTPLGCSSSAADTTAAGHHAAQLQEAEEGTPLPPIVLAGAVDPTAILGSDPSGWVSVLRALTPKLPVQLHCEPFFIKDGASPDSPPLFHTAVDALKAVPQLGYLMQETLPTGEPRRARIKMRMATAGKFMHRNRYRRQQILVVLHGEATWMMCNPSMTGEGADAVFAATSNDNWNGFRSTAFPKMLTLEEMHAVKASMPPEVDCRIFTLRAGDVLAFDGRWWHGTSYTAPVLSLFFTPGDDLEVALKEHKRRRAMPMQSNLKLATISLAKVAKLSSAWNTAADGTTIDWAATEGHIADPYGKARAAAAAAAAVAEAAASSSSADTATQ